MDVNTVAVVIAGGGALGVLVWVLAKLGKALITIAEALAAASSGLPRPVAGDKGRALGVPPDTHALANQPDCAGCLGVVALVGVAITGHHRGRARGDAHRVVPF